MRKFQVFILSCRMSIFIFNGNLHGDKHLRLKLTQSLQTDPKTCIAVL